MLAPEMLLEARLVITHTLWAAGPGRVDLKQQIVKVIPALARRPHSPVANACLVFYGSWVCMHCTCLRGGHKAPQGPFYR